MQAGLPLRGIPSLALNCMRFLLKFTWETWSVRTYHACQGYLVLAIRKPRRAQKQAHQLATWEAWSPCRPGALQDSALVARAVPVAGSAAGSKRLPTTRWPGSDAAVSEDLQPLVERKRYHRALQEFHFEDTHPVRERCPGRALRENSRLEV
mmetsp:Transcript_5370/g.12634  ORF Transcript_5370/g.12634 Transcript_5370/m.12634 type:complete len:152 (+) Transcript_5370:28-483(+)